LLLFLLSVIMVLAGPAAPKIHILLESVLASVLLGPIQLLHLSKVAKHVRASKARSQVGENAALLESATTLFSGLASYAVLVRTLPNLLKRPAQGAKAAKALSLARRFAAALARTWPTPPMCPAQVVKAARALSQARRFAAALERTWPTPSMCPAQVVKAARALSLARRFAAALERTWPTPPMCPAQGAKAVKFQVLAPHYVFRASIYLSALTFQRLALGAVS
jgi:hypothetical protein